MRRRVLILVLPTLAISLCIVWRTYLGSGPRFIGQFVKDIQADSIQERFHTTTLESGESVNIMLHHSCCSGIGFDAVIVWSSKDRILKSTRNYCGSDVFMSQKIWSEASSFAEVEDYLLENGFSRVVFEDDTQVDVQAIQPQICLRESSIRRPKYL